jgi:hypothetical protein
MMMLRSNCKTRFVFFFVTILWWNGTTKKEDWFRIFEAAEWVNCCLWALLSFGRKPYTPYNRKLT